ncbi:aminoacyl tRNA synthase complex-interacting multifunctional protein 1 [Aplysia californica]|uniref:Aminoacyl tRNA synthase complex-interacting multifunctional protein 1 n=1 Tax=Aplysia californica TaxID=6500 RepID=A0ABM0K1U5_APLCA|nr:aminoacyl tRNA synthase complex-interacting multifunctional protein 1 [Aplysia californica]
MADDDIMVLLKSGQSLTCSVFPRIETHGPGLKCEPDEQCHDSKTGRDDNQNLRCCERNVSSCNQNLHSCERNMSSGDQNAHCCCDQIVSGGDQKVLSTDIDIKSRFVDKKTLCDDPNSSFGDSENTKDSSPSVKGGPGEEDSNSRSFVISGDAVTAERVSSQRNTKTSMDTARNERDESHEDKRKMEEDRVKEEGEKEEADNLRAENDRLKAEICALQNRLMMTQMSKGVRQLRTVGRNTTTPPGLCPDPCPDLCPDPCPDLCPDPCPDLCPDPCPDLCPDPCSDLWPVPPGVEFWRPPVTAVRGTPIDIGVVDLRVGRVLTCQPLGDSENLTIQQVDIGEATPISVVTGLRKHGVTIEQIQGHLGVFLCNVRPKKIKGVRSEAILMVVMSWQNRAELLFAPRDSEPGDKVQVEGYTTGPARQSLCYFTMWRDRLMADTDIGEEGEATYRGRPLAVTGKGPVFAPTLRHGAVC